MSTKPRRKKKIKLDTFRPRGFPMLSQFYSDEIMRDLGANSLGDLLPRIEHLLVEIRDELRAARGRKSRR